MDVMEEADHFVLRVDLPGMSEADVAVEIQDRTLTISGERSYLPKPENDGGYIRLERSYGSFQRSLTLPDGIDADSISASFTNGVLELSIPKPVEAQPRRIQIRGPAESEMEGAVTGSKRSRKDRILNHG
jgi:HSP20 family protein